MKRTKLWEGRVKCLGQVLLGNQSNWWEWATQPGKPLTQSRKCTDIFWLILFAIVWVGVIVICIYGSRLGDLQRLDFPRDSEGNLCGSGIGQNSQRDLSSMPYLVYFSLSFSGSYRRCSSSCYNSSSPYICMYGVSNDTATLPTNLLLGYFPVYN